MRGGCQFGGWNQVTTCWHLVTRLHSWSAALVMSQVSGADLEGGVAIQPRLERSAVRDWSKSIGEGGWAGAFGNVVDKKHMTNPLSSAQGWLTHP